MNCCAVHELAERAVLLDPDRSVEPAHVANGRTRCVTHRKHRDRSDDHCGHETLSREKRRGRRAGDKTHQNDRTIGKRPCRLHRHERQRNRRTQRNEIDASPHERTAGPTNPTNHEERNTQDERILNDRREDDWRDDRIEHAAEQTADGDRQVERSEAIRGRAGVGKAAVTGEADKEQCGEVGHEVVWKDRVVDEILSERGADRQRGVRNANALGQLSPGEGDHMREEVQTKGHDPQQRHGCDIGGDVRGDAHDQARWHERQHDPSNPQPSQRRHRPGRRRGLGLGRGLGRGLVGRCLGVHRRLVGCCLGVHRGHVGRCLAAHRRRIGVSSRGARRFHEPGDSNAAQDERKIRSSPPTRLRGDRHRPIQDEGHREQAGEAADVGDCVEEVWVTCVGTTPEAEPSLHERTCRSHGQIWQANGGGEDSELPPHRVAFARGLPRSGEGHREKDDCADQQCQVCRRLHPRRKPCRREVGEEVAAEENGLKEHERGIPDRRAPAEAWKELARHDRLHREPERGSEKGRKDRGNEQPGSTGVCGRRQGHEFSIGHRPTLREVLAAVSPLRPSDRKLARFDAANVTGPASAKGSGSRRLCEYRRAVFLAVIGSV